MIQKNIPEELITPAEAANIISGIVNITTLNRVRKFLQTWDDKNVNFLVKNNLDSMWTLTAIYELGRIQGIREQRKKMCERTATNAAATVVSELRQEQMKEEHKNARA